MADHGLGVFEIMNDVDYCLKGSIGQAAADARSLDLWTTSNTNKTDEWLQGSDPTISAWINSLKNLSAADFAKALKNHLPEKGDGPFAVNNWSLADALQLQELITSKDDDAQKWSAVVSQIGPFLTFLQSVQGQDTTTGTSEMKNVQSALQTDNSATQPIADFGSSWADFWSSTANVEAQLSPS